MFLKAQRGPDARTSLRMRDGQMASTQSAHKGAAKPNLCDHYKPVGIQAISAATVCRAPKPAPKSSWVK